MANEDLFPLLNYDNWDNLDVASNEQRYLPNPNKVTEESLSRFWDKLNNEYPTGHPQRVQKVNDFRKIYTNKLTPYNYVPPAHALEPHLGFAQDPNNAYRMMTDWHNSGQVNSNVHTGVVIRNANSPQGLLKNKTQALQDFLNTGQIRGNPNRVNGGRVFLPPEANSVTWSDGTTGFAARGKEIPQAYFMPRHIQPTYYGASDPERALGGITLADGTRGRLVGSVGQNTMIEINKDFAPINQTNFHKTSNPLYYMGNQEGVDAEAFRLRGGMWGENTGAGAHITVNPRENPTFFDVANPANRKGIRILQEKTPAISPDEKVSINNRAIYGKTKPPDPLDILYQQKMGWAINPNEGNVHPADLAGTAPEAAKIKWDTKYDRITPFSKRPIATHLANVKAEAEIFYNASKTAPLSTKLGSLGAMAGLGGAAKGVGLVAGGIMSPIQIGMQINALTEKNMIDREYGHSDPFAFRPLVDLALSGIGHNQTPAEGYRAMGQMVADPEWQMRNPISAVPYNLLQGNLEPLKAFAGGLKDFYTPSFLK